MHKRTVDEARGRWRGILKAFGIAERFLNGKHQPCLLCGGKDRARFTDLNGDGTYFCSQCGPGSGLTLLMKLRGWNWREAVMEVDKIIGKIPITKSRKTTNMKQERDNLNALWAASYPVQNDDPVSRYLAGRRIDTTPSCLRTIARLRYQAESPSWHWAMLAMVSHPDGRPSTIHRTYLTEDGRKASVDAPRRMMPGLIAKGGAVRLCEHGNVLGIAEGIETALSATILFGVPCWAALSEGLMRNWQPPIGVCAVVVFGDNDRNFVGQSAAYELARRLSIEKRVLVEVNIPSRPGDDWNDVLMRDEVAGERCAS